MEDERMDNMDNFRERFEALEQQTEQLKQHTQALEANTRAVERRLRWWRATACGVIMLGLLTWALPSGKAADAPGRGMAERMATLEKKLAAMDFDEPANEVVITGANLRIVNGLGSTETMNGLGNLIVGYNETRREIPACSDVTPTRCTDNRTGSHNVVVGMGHNFSSFGGLVIGELNEISGRFASVSGGRFHTASGDSSAVSGGLLNTASGFGCSVSGGNSNTASGVVSSVSGGAANMTDSTGGSISGGVSNPASGAGSSVSGGLNNTARSTWSSVSGGENNLASGEASSVSGGANRTAPATDNWAAGALFSNN
jgi:hypothetical protein